MRFYFTASLTGKKLYFHQYQAIVDRLVALGHETISSHILNSVADEVRQEPEVKRAAYIKYMQNGLSQSDGLIAETSYPSVRVGYEISYALQRGKPVLVLYSTKAGYPPVLAGVEDDRLFIEEYSDVNIRKVLSQFVLEIGKIQDQRFTMLLSGDIINYLDDLAEKGQNRSEFIRKLIRKEMRGK